MSNSELVSKELLPAPLEQLELVKHEELSQPSGTLSAASIAEALCRTEGAIWDFDKGTRESPVFVALTQCIHDILKEEADEAAKENAVSSGQTGTGSPSAHDEPLQEDEEMCNDESVFADLRAMADWHTRSHPGPDNVASNTGISSAICELQEPNCRFPKWKIKNITYTLKYRIGVTKLATAYKNFLKIEYKDCQEIDATREYNKTEYSLDRQLKTCLEECRRIVLDNKGLLFDKPIDSEGRPYNQPTPYMAVTLFSTGWTDHDMKAALMRCVEYKRKVWDVRRAITPLTLI